MGIEIFCSISWLVLWGNNYTTTVLDMQMQSVPIWKYWKTANFLLYSLNMKVMIHDMPFLTKYLICHMLDIRLLKLGNYDKSIAKLFIFFNSYRNRLRHRVLLILWNHAAWLTIVCTLSEQRCVIREQCNNCSFAETNFKLTWAVSIFMFFGLHSRYLCCLTGYFAV